MISSDGQFALSGSWDGTLRLWDLNTGNTTRRFVGHTKDVLSVAFSVDNRQVRDTHNIAWYPFTAATVLYQHAKQSLSSAASIIRQQWSLHLVLAAVALHLSATGHIASKCVLRQYAASALSQPP